MASSPSSYSLYIKHVFAQRRRNPCLGGLCDFLSASIFQSSCRIASLEFSGGDDEPPTRHDFGTEDLMSFLKSRNSSNAEDSDSNNSQSRGSILFVEDLTKEVVEILGSELDIDPLFFASHIHGPFVTIQSAKPSTVVLPSEIAKQNFLSLQFQKALEFGKEAADFRKVFSYGNIPRRVMLLSADKRTTNSIGLVQQSCSVFLTKRKRNGWLAVMLVDASTKAIYRSSEKEVILESQPFQGGFEDFSERRPCHVDDNSGPGRISLLEDLIYYFTQHLPPYFDAQSPSLLALSYYPLKIVAAEWVHYVEVLSITIKEYEYSIEQHAQADILTKLNSDLRDLQSWVRRCMQTVQKLRYVIRFVERRTESEVNKEVYILILEDYRLLIEKVEIYGVRLQAMVPNMTNLVQIADSKQSLREAADVKRLTNLSLLFVPLSFVTSLFSMNDGVSPRGLLLFFSVAVPLCLIVAAIAHRPLIKFCWLVKRA